MSALQVGDRVTWRHELRGGYGYTEAIPAVVRSQWPPVGKVGRVRVLLEVPLKAGGTRLVWVDPANVAPAIVAR
jgi:hypothetical protein